MSVFSAWSYTGRCTVWEPITDEYDQPTGYTRREYRCTFRAGGQLMADASGAQFTPTSTVWLEAPLGSQPKVGSYIVFEASAAAEPPPDAQEIKRVAQHDPSLFSQGLPDWEIATA